VVDPSDPTRASAVDLARALRRGRTTSREVVDAHIARIVKVNPALNALVAARFEAARAEAQAADEALARGAPGELLGVPCTIKEFIATEGMPHSAGLASRRDLRADRDAPVVARLRAEGAIVLGVTNGPEGGLWSETTNPVYGRTNNPWRRDRTPGGSSGGEAALIAAGASPLGLGSDIGGSVRIPAAFCGIVAHKPTGGLIPTDGHHPPHPSHYLCVGPMARRVADLHLALRILAGPKASTIDDLSCLPPEALVAFVPEQAIRRASGPVRAALLTAIEALRTSGAEVHTFSLPDLDRAFWIWGAALTASDGPSYAEILFDGADRSVWPELAKSAVGASRHSAPPLVVAAAEAMMAALRLVDNDHLLARRDRLAEELRGMLDARTVLLLPTMPRAAPRHGGMFLRFADSGWCGLWNVLGLPATTVPAGFTRGGLPIGLQVVAGRGLDHVALAGAQAVESTTGGWVRANP
jgi:fatty acid amide hydrolase 2